MRLFGPSLLLLLFVYDADGFQTPHFLANAFNRFVGFFSSSSSNSSVPLPPTLLLNIPEPEVIGGDAEASVRRAFAEAAAFIRERLNTTADPCNNFFQYACSAQKSHETVFQSMDVQVRRLMMRAMRQQPTNPLTMKAHAYLERCFEHFKRPKYSEGVEEVRFLLTHLPHWRFPAVVHSAANLPALSAENVAHTFGVLYRFAGVNFGLRLRFERLPAPLVSLELDTLVGHDRLASFAEVMGVASGVFGDPLDWSGMEAPVRRAHELVWSRMERENEHLTTATEDVQLQHVDEKFPNFRLSTYIKTVASGVPELEALLQPTTTVRLPTSFLAGLNAAIADARLTPVRAVAFVSLVNFRLFEGMFRPAAVQERGEESDRFERGPAATSMRTTGGETDCVFDSRGVGILMSRLLLDVHFPSSDARERHENVTARMAGLIRDNLRSMLWEIEWLDEAGRTALIQKLDHFRFVLGYNPQLFDDYFVHRVNQLLAFTSSDSFARMRRAAAEAELRLEAMRARGELKTSGREMEPDFVFMVNAFYEPTTHTVVIPFGYQLAPFFDVNFPRSIRYGRLGWSMGHEMAHAFDPVLFDYDEHFNHRHLLLNAPRSKFAQSVECLVREYDRIDPENPGSTTENVADITGIRVAYRAFKDFEDLRGPEPRLDDPLLRHFTSEQLFFLAAAQKYCSQLEHVDNEHPPGFVRVMATFRNFAPFADAFNCPRDSRYAPAERCDVWISGPRSVARLGDS